MKIEVLSRVLFDISAVLWVQGCHLLTDFLVLGDVGVHTFFLLLFIVGSFLMEDYIVLGVYN